MPFQRTLLRFLALFCFFAASTVYAVPLSSLFSGESGKDTSATSNRLLQLLDQAPNSLDYGNNSQSGGKLASFQLEQRFRSHGDIGAILKWAPGLVDASSKDDVIRALYAVALAASGDLSNAKGMLNRFDENLHVGYREMAKALIAQREGKLDAALKHARKAVSYDKTHPYAYNILGRILAAKALYPQALEAFHEATQLSPNYVVSYANAGAIQFALGRYAEAAESFSLAINKAPQYCEARYGRAVLAEVSRNYPQAIADLQACLQANSSYLEAKKKLAYLYMRSGLLTQAESLAQAFAKEDATYAQLLLGDIYLRMDKPAKAKQVLSKIADKNVQAAYLLAFASFLDKQVDVAIKQTQAILDKDPEASGVKFTNILFKADQGDTSSNAALASLGRDPSVGPLAKFALANITAAQGEMEKAMSLWNGAENFLPGFSVAGLNGRELVGEHFSREAMRLNLGVLFYIKELYLAAVNELQQAVMADSHSPMAHYFMAVSYVAMGEEAKARKALEMSLDKAPKFFSANYLLAEMHARSGDYKTAVKYYKAAADSKDDAGIFVKLGILYEKEDEFAKAEQIYERFIKSYPDNFVAYNQLAWLYAQRGEKLDRSLSLASKADRLQPNNASIQDTLGWVQYQKKNYRQAIAHLEKANQVSHERNPQILYHLASARYGMGERLEAKRALEQAFNISEQFEGVDEAKRLYSKLQ